MERACIAAAAGRHPERSEVQVRFCPPASSARATQTSVSPFNAFTPTAHAFTSDAPYAASAPYGQLMPRAMPEQLRPRASFTRSMAGTPAAESTIAPAPTLPRTMDAATRMPGRSTIYGSQVIAVPSQAADPSASRVMTGLLLDPVFAFDMAGPSATQMMAGLSVNPAMANPMMADAATYAAMAAPQVPAQGQPFNAHLGDIGTQPQYWAPATPQMPTHEQHFTAHPGHHNTQA
ncbi:hypothetical protein ZHAS_00018797 [Anopheles sinensis]|uniref:Uncharacterized protein n=1 Tax=Anopheles sinensis TaxID=74873 RepID=A0A084WKK6_ANOSI|nr:hypothetical protein ZHAS_00018797 [Anopheles sinensis]